MYNTYLMNKLKLYKALLLFVLVSALFSACEPDPELTKEKVQISNKTSNYSSKHTNEWLSVYMDVEKDLPNFRPAATSRALAYIWMAAYEAALPGMPKFVSNETKLSGLNIPSLPHDVEQYDWNIAVNAALASCYEHFLIGATVEHKAKIKDLEVKINAEYSSTEQEIFTNSQEWGRAVADAIIAYSKTDEEAEKQVLDAFAADYTPPIGEGKWRAEKGKALFPYWGKVRTFASFGDDLLSPEPPAFSTNSKSTYYIDFEEVNQAIIKNDNEKRWRAEFWSDDLVGVTFSPPARIFQIANQMIAIEQLDLETTLHLLVKLGIAENDGAVAAWRSKYHYNVERPIHFITDHINPDFMTILGEAMGSSNVTPPFPGYPSGHSTFGGLGISVLTHFFGEDYTFTDRCHEDRAEFKGYPRTYTTITAMMEENAYSRIPLGVHPRFDCDEGLRLGKLVGNNAVKYALKVR